MQNTAMDWFRREGIALLKPTNSRVEHYIYLTVEEINIHSSIYGFRDADNKHFS